MRSRLLWVVAAVATAAGTAGAQPLFSDERNWTLDGGGGRRYGVTDIVSAESGSRVTQIWVGFYLIEPGRPSDRWVLDVLPLRGLLGVREGYYRVRGRAAAAARGRRARAVSPADLANRPPARVSD